MKKSILVVLGAMAVGVILPNYEFAQGGKKEFVMMTQNLQGAFEKCQRQADKQAKRGWKYAEMIFIYCHCASDKKKICCDCVDSKLDTFMGMFEAGEVEDDVVDFARRRCGGCAGKPKHIYVKPRRRR